MPLDIPEFITSPKGLAPGEVRLVRKVTGMSVDQLDAEDQMRVMAFAVLLRLHRNPLSGDFTVDVNELWEAAEWVEVRPAEATGGMVSPLEIGSLGT
jgi:hypothetical protein